jgi:hypothetical protein
VNIETTLTEELRTVARAVPTPPPPAVADLVERAGEQRRRTRYLVAGAGALVAAVLVGVLVLGSHLGNPDSAPSPAPQPTRTSTALPTGEPLRTWTDQYGRLHLDGVAVPGKSWSDAATTGDLTVAARGEYGPEDFSVFIGTRRVADFTGLYELPVRVSPDRRTIAWTAFDEPTRKQASIVVARISEDGAEELGSLHVAALTAGADSEARETLYRVADDGTVWYGGVLGGHAWTPGSDPRPYDNQPDLMRPNGFPATDATLGLELNPSGTWGAWQTDEVPPATADDPVTYTSVVVQRRGDPSSRGKLAFAGRFAYVNIVFWETDTDVVLFADENPPGQQSNGRYLRCDVVERACEVAPAPGDD